MKVVRNRQNVILISLCKRHIKWAIFSDFFYIIKKSELKGYNKVSISNLKIESFELSPIIKF